MSIPLHMVIEGINPQPWTAPEASIGRRGGKMFAQLHKNGELRAYQEAIREEVELLLTRQYPDFVMAEGPVTLRFRVWRRLEVYENAKGHTVRKHRADATNIQKALEDALQKILFKNDSQVVEVSTIIEVQEVDVEPAIEIMMVERAA